MRRQQQRQEGRWSYIGSSARRPALKVCFKGLHDGLVLLVAAGSLTEAVNCVLAVEVLFQAAFVHTHRLAPLFQPSLDPSNATVAVPLVVMHT